MIKLGFHIFMTVITAGLWLVVLYIRYVTK